MTTRRRARMATIPRELNIARLAAWSADKRRAMTSMADALKSARMSTERKQRQVHAICLQPGQEAMAESTVARAEKASALLKTGDIGLFKAAYLAYLYDLDFSRVVRRMFPTLERNADGRDQLDEVAARLSPARLERLVAAAGFLLKEQEADDEAADMGQWDETERRLLTSTTSTPLARAQS